MVFALSPRALTRNLVIHSQKFRRDEDGALIIFALVLFLLMAMMGGVAIDIMRYETVRTDLQNTLDRCTLMAASLDQRLDPQSVVDDCVDKSGFGENLQGVQVTQSLNSRSVLSNGRVGTKPFFLHLIGIDKFDALGASGAVQAITNVEIALVLDVSGSMSGAKLANLKVAAAEFVDNMLANDPNHRISISIVPYNAQVNLGSVLRAKYQAVNLHGVTDVNCLELPASVFNTPGISRTLNLPMMAYADYNYGTSKTDAYVAPTNTSYAVPNYSNVYCTKAATNIVRLPSQNATTLKSQINGLVAGGNTSITLGMKWGLSLLDPSARGMYNELIGAGQMGANLAGRPFDYADPESMKVIVLMTDGEHVAHNRVTDGYKTGPSPIYKSTDGRYSVYHAAHAGDKYWVPHLNSWSAGPYNSGVQQQWQDVWANLKVSYVAWQFYARAHGAGSGGRTSVYNTMMNDMVQTYDSVGGMNASLQQSCALAKQSDVLVYGIAFEAPSNGQAQISQCATSSAHYYDAQSGAEIRAAFRAIASNLTQLKLTQ
ncbi:MAG: pilus assembly protein TadG-related protein [Cypionkella sp.]|uniref:pilus assembly protein TadG-related protein n=1 Tax=Cypionkella sp. TaxID=2811411 RepID=UPI002AB8FA2F|nr:pilus assembly protein TadG-related protein [Cypionkella sp.]MDZ4309330.1 pilus assembly protein TadG-related protein [Cypionkella sp.]